MDEFQYYEQCWDAEGWMYLKAWFYSPERDKWYYSIVDD